MEPETRSSRAGWICLALGLITLALFSPALTHAFLLYDDQQYVTENTHVQAGMTWQGVVWAFGSHATNWHPLTWLSHMLDCQIFGLRPWGHHLTSVLLHVANSMLLFLLLNRLTQTLWRSALVAALFAWHPLQVESVAWVAERKDVLSAFFWMLSLLAYAGYAAAAEGSEVQTPKSKALENGSRDRESSIKKQKSKIKNQSWLWYCLTLTFFALGLMSKPMVVTLPFVLLLLDYWPLRRFPGAASAVQSSKFKVQGSRFVFLLLEKLPFFALSSLACALTLSAQEPAIVSTAGLGIAQRLVHAVLAYGHYGAALLAPHRLAVYYPYQKDFSAWPLVLAGFALVMATFVALRFAAQKPYLAIGWFWFLGTLVPVIGLVQVGDQAWADRYTYLPSIGLFIALVWGLSEFTAHGRLRRPGLRCLAPTLAVALWVATSVQLHCWKDTRTLFEHANRVTRNNPLAAALLGSLLAREGHYDQAIEYYREALRDEPGFPEAQFFLGNALEHQGNLEQAIQEYQKALWFKPFQEQAHILLGAALAKQQRTKEAAAHDLAALKLNPDSAIAHNNLAKLLHAQGRLDDAIIHYSAALQLDPGLAQAHNNLGVLLLQKGLVSEGERQLREALRLQPGDAQTEINLAQALAEEEHWSEAAELFGKAVTPATADPKVHCRFATALAHLGQTRQAMSQYASALLLQPDLVPALAGLAWILATDPNPQVRNGEQSFAMAQRACDLTRSNDPECLKTLAAACAETGRFSQATFDAQAAQKLAGGGGRVELAEECGRMAEQFKSFKPWRVAR